MELIQTFKNILLVPHNVTRSFLLVMYANNMYCKALDFVIYFTNFADELFP